MNDPLRRGIRTLFQVGSVAAIIQLWNAFATVQLNTGQVGALMTFGALLVSLVQNTLEDSGAIPALLKAPASSGVNPIPDPEPESGE